jgi:hypothetical protein
MQRIKYVKKKVKKKQVFIVVFQIFRKMKRKAPDTNLVSRGILNE